MRGFISIIAVGLLAAGCTAAGSTASPVTPSPAAYAYDHSPSALVLRSNTGGGLVPIDFFLNHVPQFSLYGDGTIVVPGQVDSIYPAPLLPNLRTIHLTDAEVGRLLAAADNAGLLGPDASLTVEGIFDAPTTTFTAVVAGVTHTVSAYALGMDVQSPADQSVAAARARLAEFARRIADLGAFLDRDVSVTAAYAPASIRVFAAVYDPTTDTGGVTRQQLTWPLATDPAAGVPVKSGNYRCTALAGSDLAGFTAVAANANGLTIWTSASGRYVLMVRPNLPEESGCGLN
jgi:hypothetical protein